jgi:benzylsuccinate CoA-transferase BbsE subunit
MTGLLDGVRVLDLSDGPAAYGGRVLADLGADVILIEPPGGAPGRCAAPAHRLPSGEILSTVFAFTAAGKRSVTMDLGHPQGRDLLGQLAERADVMYLAAPAAQLTGQGLDPATLLARHPRLIVASVTPYGLRGPRRHWRGSDLTAWATSGALPMYGDPDRAPLTPREGLALAAGALSAAMGIALALTGRSFTGQGQLVDVSLQESALSVSLEFNAAVALDNGFAPLRPGKRRPTPPMGQYRARDGAVMIVAYTPWQWRALAEWIHAETGIAEVLSDRYDGTPADRAPYSTQLDEWIEALTTRYGKQEFAEEAQRRGIPVGPVNTLADLLADPHLAATDGWATTAAPGGDLLQMPAPALSVDGYRRAPGPVPAAGSHNDEILAGELGLDPPALARLRAAGMI